MKHQHYAQSWAGQRIVPSSEPIFFFDGDFRTWGQVEQRARLNSAIASYIARRSMR
ncbi:MAG: hypothetical protein L0177_02105 [Chloroflexi bacterium]|nr:hypothetical protein [Chloroflexota bacterium]